MSLNGGAERPQLHAIRSDADGPASPAGAEGQDLTEPVEQAGPFLLVDQPFELGPISGEGRVAEPLAQVLQCLLLEYGVRFDRLEAVLDLGQLVHVVTSPFRTRFN